MADTRAMADGKARVQASIVWELRVGGVASRCRRIDGERFVLDLRDDRGWKEVPQSICSDARALLRKVANSTGTRIALAEEAP